MTLAVAMVGVVAWYRNARRAPIDAPGETAPLVAEETTGAKWTGGTSLWGVVTDARTARPVAGARVVASGELGVADASSAATLGDGRFAIDHLSAGRYEVIAHAPHGFGRTPGSVVIAATEHVEIVVPIYPAFDLRGRVVARGAGRDAPAIAACDVTLARGDERQTAIVDASGAQVLEGVLPGHYGVSIGCPATEPVLTELDVTGDIDDQVWRSGAAKPERPAPAADHALRGQVLDAGGAPVAGVHVLAFGAGLDPTPRDATTFADGSFALQLPSGAFNVEVRRSDKHGQALRTPDGGKAIARVDTRHSLAPLALRVERMDRAIHGVIHDDHGQPVPHAEVTVERELVEAGRDTTASTGVTPAISDEHGEFRLEGLAAGTYTVEAQHASGSAGERHHVDTGEHVTLTLDPVASVVGIARLDGVRLDRFRVRVYGENHPERHIEHFFQTGGAFQVHGLRRGRYLIAIDDDLHAGEWTSLPITTPQTTIITELTARAAVTGRVVDDHDRPLPHILVELSARLSVGDRPEIRTDHNGRFTIRNAPTGESQLLIGTIDLPIVIDGPGTQDLGTLTLSRSR